MLCSRFLRVALADKWGTRRVLMLAAWLWLIITVMQATVGLRIFQTSIISALTAFMAYRFTLGIAASPTYPAAGKGVASWVQPSLQGRANGMVLASIGLGAALTPPLVSNVMVNWPLSYQFHAIPYGQKWNSS